MKTNITYENLKDGNAHVFSDGERIGTIMKRGDNGFVYIPLGRSNPLMTLSASSPSIEMPVIFTSKSQAVEYVREKVDYDKRTDLEYDLVEMLNKQQPLAEFITCLVERIEGLEDDVADLRRELGSVKMNGAWDQGLPPQR